MSNSMQPQQDNVPWAVVLMTYNPGEANIVAGRLQSEGIGAWVHQEPFGSAMGITFGKLGEVKVVVRTEDYERALAILEADDLDALPEDVDQDSFDDEDTLYLDQDTDDE